jgi:hypothetical protein
MRVVVAVALVRVDLRVQEAQAALAMVERILLLVQMQPLKTQVVAVAVVEVDSPHFQRVEMVHLES